MLHNFIWHSLLCSTWKSRIKKMKPYLTEKQCKIFPMQLNFSEIVWQSKLQEQHYFFFFLKVSKERNLLLCYHSLEQTYTVCPHSYLPIYYLPKNFDRVWMGPQNWTIQNCLGGKELSNLASECVSTKQ